MAQEPYGVKWTNKHGQSTIYTHETAKAAKASAELANRDPGSLIHWKSVAYVGRKF